MKIDLNYEGGILKLPAAALDHLDRADESAVKVLLRLAVGDDPSRAELAEFAGISASDVDRALAFWNGAGLVRFNAAGKGKAKKSTDASFKEPAPAPECESGLPTREENVTVVDSATSSQKTRVLADPSALPRYTTEELNALLERRTELGGLISECNQVFGKILNPHEINVLLSLVDYLNLDGEYLLLLLAHCAGMGKKSIRYVETCALSLYDEGVTDARALEEHLKRRERVAENESAIRALFGMNSRALTAKERKMIDAWINTYQYGMDVITRAYETTVNATGKASVPYANSILERWATAGFHTIGEIEVAEEKKDTRAPAKPGNSFDTDDFFDAALKRSFGDDYTPAGNYEKKN